MLVRLLFALLPAWVAATGTPLPGFWTCDQQSRCITVSKEKLSSSFCGDDTCDIKVCVNINFNLPYCDADDYNQVNHVCTFNPNAHPDECAPYPLTFDGNDLVEWVASGSTHCIIVKAGHTAPFIFRDGKYCSDLTAHADYSRIPDGTTCVKSTEDMYDDSIDFQSCASAYKEGKECVWMFPTHPDDCGPLDDPPNGVNGDPHFRTWSGDKWSYHGACDMVLVEAPKLDLAVHIRTKHRRQFSYVSHVGIRLGNDILEIAGKDWGYALNGVKGLPLPLSVGGYKVTRTRRDEDSDLDQTFTIELLDGQQIVVKTWMDFVSVRVLHPKKEYFETSVGLMGDFHTGARLGRNGEYIRDVEEFAKDWQVQGNDLFMEFAHPQFPHACVAPPAATGRRLGEGVTEEAAQAACAHVHADDLDFCIFDVLATNDVAMAGAY